MRYLPHIEVAIRRLGYIKPEYAAALAVLMEDHEGLHPHQIARLFRQTGSQLPAETKRALGVRSNADMSAEAADALTQRGLASPLKGLDATLLDASFSYFRTRSVEDAARAGRDSFKVDGMFSADCAGCRRLDGSKVTSVFLEQVPPSDCGREACGIGMRLHIDFVGELVEQEVAAARRSEAKPLTFLERLLGRRKSP